MKKPVFVFLCMMVFLSPLFSASAEVDVERIRQETFSSFSSIKTSRLEFDRNKDGKIDHVMILDEKGRKLYEELDYNFDGRFDDLCFYTNGVLQSEWIDTNFDGKIDLWVYIKNGVYVDRYERDTNYDGVVDKVKQFGQKK
ncbi:MAG: hypothetical protein N2442_11290 [Spirochaetes bacterium]|nr:hypothetical protein [Spirochaetota bacterium]